MIRECTRGAAVKKNKCVHNQNALTCDSESKKIITGVLHALGRNAMLYSGDACLLLVDVCVVVSTFGPGKQSRVFYMVVPVGATQEACFALYTTFCGAFIFCFETTGAAVRFSQARRIVSVRGVRV